MTTAPTFLRIAALVGRRVEFASHGENCHGVVTRATWSTLGEPVLIIHPDQGPAALSADIVLIGPSAAEVVAAANGREAAA